MYQIITIVLQQILVFNLTFNSFYNIKGHLNGLENTVTPTKAERVNPTVSSTFGVLDHLCTN